MIVNIFTYFVTLDNRDKWSNVARTWFVELTSNVYREEKKRLKNSNSNLCIEGHTFTDRPAFRILRERKRIISFASATSMTFEFRKTRPSKKYLFLESIFQPNISPLNSQPFRTRRFLRVEVPVAGRNFLKRKSRTISNTTFLLGHCVQFYILRGNVWVLLQSSTTFR